MVQNTSVIRSVGVDQVALKVAAYAGLVAREEITSAPAGRP
jgi:hypothetical protein